MYFISFLLLVGFFVLNMFVGVVVENFHKCRESQEKEEKARRAAKRAKKLEKKRRSTNNPNYQLASFPLPKSKSGSYWVWSESGQHLVNSSGLTFALDIWLSSRDLSEAYSCSYSTTMPSECCHCRFFTAHFHTGKPCSGMCFDLVVDTLSEVMDKADNLY